MTTAIDLAAASRATDWRTTAAEQANKSWYVWRSQNGPQGLSDMEVDLHEAFAAGFAKGAGWAFVESSKLAPAMATLADFVDFLRASTGPQLDLEEMREAWRAVKDSISLMNAKGIDAIADMEILLALHDEGAR